MTADSENRRWLFANAVFDESTLELEVDGEVVPLERRPLDVLRYLLSHCGEVVTKQELADSLWPGRILTETVLTRCISLLRHALKDHDRTLIKTVHGYGYRLTPAATVEAIERPERPEPPTVTELAIGNSPPLRPQWKLVERLGAGAHGEAWLGVHDTTQEARVFKFAVGADALTSLKREIAIQRILREALGEAAPIARILEWNFEEEPCYLETEYVPGRDLHFWAEARGGLAKIPVADRLELAIQITEAVAAAHSAGVLHKDLKPGNLLVAGDMKNPIITLADFGSGAVVGSAQLQAAGITKSTLDTSSNHRGTPPYGAPEVIAGQPSTAASDVYALGVLLYQLLAADFRKPLAPGWDHDVGDELLKEDIAQAANLDRERRFADAAELAMRLRNLEGRRQIRELERATRERAERTQALRKELKRARGFALAMLALAAVAVGGGYVALTERATAIEATRDAKAINAFLTDDVLRVDPKSERPRDASYESLLNRAAAQADERFSEQPEAAASIHWLLGRRYQEIGEVDRATTQYEHAVAMYTRLYGRGDERTLLVLDRLAWIYVDRGRSEEAIEIAQELRRQWARGHGEDDLSTLMLRTRTARTFIFAGEIETADSELRRVLHDIPAAKAPTPELASLFTQWFGLEPAGGSLPELLHAYANGMLGANVLAEFGEDYKQAEPRVRQAVDTFSRILGDESETAAWFRLGLGFVLTGSGQHEEAERIAQRSIAFYDAWLPPRHFYRSIPLIGMARLRLEEHRPDEALPLIEQALSLCSSNKGCPERARAEYSWHLGRAYDELGRTQDAIRTFQEALPVYEKFRGRDHVGSLRIRISLADSLRKAGRSAEAGAVLAAISAKAVAVLSPQHPVIADYQRVQGLLALQRGDYANALALLEHSCEILNARLGATHWRTVRARDELAKARGQSKAVRPPTAST